MKNLTYTILFFASSMLIATPALAHGHNHATSAHAVKAQTTNPVKFTPPDMPGTPTMPSKGTIHYAKKIRGLGG